MILAMVNGSAGAAPLESSTFTEVIREVNILPPPATPRCRPCERRLEGARPRAHRPMSRAELTAPDQTITAWGQYHLLV